jgi:glucose/arabinose dehydrogenase
MKREFSLTYLMTAGLLAAVTCTIVAGCTPAGVPENVPAAAAADAGPRVFETTEHKIRVVTVAEGLSFPYSMAFLPDGGMLLTEMGGRIRLLRDGVLAPEPVGVIPEVFHDGPSHGLMDIALHPNFAENRQVYLTYNKPGERGATVALARGTFDGSRLNGITDIFVANAWAMTDARQNSRIAFGRDGMLYMTAAGGRSEQDRAQQGVDHSGKVLRLRDDGTVAAGNPFAGSNRFLPEVYSYGHNNVHGIAVHPETGELWVVEHGDKASVLKPGANYGWPFVKYGPSTTAAQNPEPLGVQLTAPHIVWDPDVHISGIMFYTGDKFPEWKGDLFVGGLRTQQVNHVPLSKEPPRGRESLFTEIGGWVRDVRQGPDGLIYFTTYEDPAGPGRVMRIEPSE